MTSWILGLSQPEQWAIGIVALLLVGIISQWVGQRLNHALALVREQKKQSDSAAIAHSIFWSAGTRYKILAVHQYAPSNDVSGYTHLGQNSRPDQWQKLIRIETSFLGLRHKVVPLDKEHILDVVISRNGEEQWKVLSFNK